MYITIQSSILCNSNRKDSDVHPFDKQNEVYLCKWTLFSNMEDWLAETYNMDEHWKQYGKWKNPVIMDYPLYAFVYSK